MRFPWSTVGSFFFSESSPDDGAITRLPGFYHCPLSHGDMIQRFCISIPHCKEMPQHRRDVDRTSHVTRCCSKRPCFGWCEESVAEICFVQLGETSRPRGEKPRLSSMFDVGFADTDCKKKMVIR